MSRKRWVMASVDKESAALLAEQCGLDPFLALMLVTRDVCDPEAAEEFFTAGGAAGGYAGYTGEDPFCFADMDAAVTRIQCALDNGEKIAVYGDYDADGVTSTVLLYSYLCSKGASAVFHIPDREKEGYGLSLSGIDALAAQSVNLIITVDNGISAAREIDYARDRGIDVVVTDHHQPPPELPRAAAAVNPHRADCESGFKEYAGVGVVYKLVCALEGDDDTVLEQYGDLVALGTMADIVSLRGENRFLVRAGLEVINSGVRPGISCLRKAAGSDGKPVTATAALFSLVPRINAAGRMGSPLPAAELLLCTDTDEGDKYAEQVHQSNTERQSAESEIMEEAVRRLESSRELLFDRVLVAEGEGWHPGVIGIIASRLTERYARPCIVITTPESAGDGGRNADDGVKPEAKAAAKGSGRSVRGFNLHSALQSCEDLLERFGGHELAAGLSLDPSRIGELRERINRYAAENFPEMPFPETVIDFKLSPAQVSVEKAELAQMLEPFGPGNPQPVFGLFRMCIDKVDFIGKGRHTRLTLSRDNVRVQALKFGMGQGDFPYKAGQTVDLAVTIERNEYNGVVSPSLFIREIRCSGVRQDTLLAAYRQYDRVMRGEALTPEEKTEWRPRREELERLYRHLRAAPWSGPAEQLAHCLGEPDIPYIRLLLSLETLYQAGLIDFKDHGTHYTASVLPSQGKTDLEKTKVFSQLTTSSMDN